MSAVQGPAAETRAGIAGSARVLGYHFASLALGQVAALTAQAALRMSHSQAGLGGPLREEAERFNRYLTMQVHKFRLRADVEAVGWRNARPQDWHTHGCAACGTGTACFEDCEPVPLDRRMSESLYVSS